MLAALLDPWGCWCGDACDDTAGCMEALERSWLEGLEEFAGACSDARSCDSLRRFFNRPPKLGMEDEGRGP